MNTNFYIENNKPILPEFSLTALNNVEITNTIEIPTGFLHSLIYVSSGNGILEIDFDEHIAVKNKLFFIEKYKYWRWTQIEKLDGVMIQFSDSFYNIIYTGNPKIRSDESLIGNIPSFIKIEENGAREFQEIISIISEEYAHSKNNSKEIICLSLKILIMLYRRVTNSEEKLFISDRKKQLLS